MIDKMAAITLGSSKGLTPKGMMINISPNKRKEVKIWDISLILIYFWGLTNRFYLMILKLWMKKLAPRDLV